MIAPGPKQLFQHAFRQLQRNALAEFQRTPLGQVAREVSRISKGRPAGGGVMGQLPGGAVVKRLAQAARGGPRAMLRAAVGSELGGVVRMIERYARGGSSAPEAVKLFLEELGPLGELLQLLTEPIAGVPAKGPLARQFAAAIRFLQAFGYQVIPPGETDEDRIQRQIAELQALGYRVVSPGEQYLESLGYAVIPPGEEPKERPRLPEGIEQRPGRKTVDVPMAGGQVKRLRPDHPLLTGEFVQVASSNVHSYSYDYEAAALYIRFLDHGDDGARGGPGPLYRYDNVEPELALDLERAASKGGWVWDHLRIRGTISGHQKDYALVGVPGGYVPRKATLTEAGETLVPRNIRLPGGQWVQSKRPLAVVRPLSPVGVL